MYCIVALILGMLLANMLKNVCGCKTVVEGAGPKRDPTTGQTIASTNTLICYPDNSWPDNLVHPPNNCPAGGRDDSGRCYGPDDCGTSKAVAAASAAKKKEEPWYDEVIDWGKHLDDTKYDND